MCSRIRARWRQESDRSQRDVVVPLLLEAVEAVRRAKKRAGIQIRGLGFHREKRAGVRDPWFRELDPKTKETLSRTNHATLIAIYDEVELDEMRRAIQRRRPAAQAFGR